MPSRAQESTQSTESTFSRVKWTEAMEDTLVDHLLTELNSGKKTDGVFKIQSFRDALEAINTVLSPEYSRPTITVKHVQVKWNNMKRDYKDFSFIKNSSGLGWDESTQKLTCEQKVWDAFVEKNPYMKKFKDKGIRNYDKLGQIVEGMQATRELIVNTATKKRPARIHRASESAIAIVTPTTVIPASAAPPTVPPTSATPRTAPTIITPTPSNSQAREEAQIESGSEIERYPKRSRRGEKRGLHSLAISLNKIAEVAERQMGFRKPSIREITLKKLQTDFPKLDVGDFIAACELFEETVKCEIFLALQQKNISKAWLRNQFQKRQYIPTSKNLQDHRYNPPNSRLDDNSEQVDSEGPEHGDANEDNAASEFGTSPRWSETPIQLD